MFSLDTPRLILRDLLETDFPAFYRLCCQPEVLRFQDYLRGEDEAHARRLLQDALVYNNRDPRTAYSLAIVRRGDQAWLGWIGFGKADDSAIGDIEVGYAVLEEYFGNGYTTEALRRVVDFCFQQPGIGKIYAECIQENTASARVMEKAGLRFDQKYPDTDGTTETASFTLRYSLTREDWESHASRR